MVNIAIVDDDKNERNRIMKTVKEFFGDNNIPCLVKTFSNGEDLISYPKTLDLIFLDINMAGIDGIQAAQILRRKNYQTTIFYITSYADYIMKTMTIHPFAFIVKPMVEDDLKKNLNDYLDYRESLNEINKPIYFNLLCGDQFVPIDIKKIYYFHYLQNREIEVATEFGVYKIKDSMSKLYSSLDHNYFFIPNRSFIVNMGCIKRVDNKNKSLIMNDDSVVLIPRRKYAEVLNTLNEYFINR